MSDARIATTDIPDDISDVVEGPIGSARLRNPATPGPKSGDLDTLEPIDGEGDASDDTRPIDGQSPADGSAPEARERQEADRVGVDWERTGRDRG